MLAASDGGRAATELALAMALGVGGQWLALRLRLPSILVLLIAGFAVGPFTELFFDRKLIDPDPLFGPLLFPFVGLAVGVILLEGGLSLRRSELEEIGPGLRRLLSVGVLVTWLGTALAAHAALDFPWTLAALIGALLVVTGPTVTIPLLAFVRPRGSVGALVKWEGIVNDPIGAVLAVLVFEWIRAGGGREAAGDVVLAMLASAGIGIGLGLAAGWGLGQLLRRHLVPDTLQSPLVLLVSLLFFALSNQLRAESGLITVTVLGISLANQERVRLEHIVEFKENLRVVLIGTLFVLLAARLDLADIATLGPGSLVFAALMILVVRPLSVALSGIGTDLGRRELAFLALMAPRGIVAAAVSSLFAIELAALGVPRASELAPVVFVVIVATVVVYGLLAAPIARRLGLADPETRGLLLLGAHPFARAMAAAITGEGIPVVLVDTNRTQVAAARLEGLRAFNANILSEYAETRVPLDGVGRFLALTPNDEVNSLAVSHLEGRFERAQLYQLPPEWMSDAEPESEAYRKRVTVEVEGRLLFAPHANFWELDARLSRGARIRITPLTEDFGLAEYRARHGDRALPLVKLTKAGGLVVVTADEALEARPGDRLVSLVDPEQPQGA